MPRTYKIQDLMVQLPDDAANLAKQKYTILEPPCFHFTWFPTNCQFRGNITWITNCYPLSITLTDPGCGFYSPVVQQPGDIGDPVIRQTVREQLQASLKELDLHDKAQAASLEPQSLEEATQLEQTISAALERVKQLKAGFEGK